MYYNRDYMHMHIIQESNSFAQIEQICISNNTLINNSWAVSKYSAVVGSEIG